MNGENYKKVISSMLKEIDSNDFMFLKQLYTIIIRHLERRGRR